MRVVDGDSLWLARSAGVSALTQARAEMPTSGWFWVEPPAQERHQPVVAQWGWMTAIRL